MSEKLLGQILQKLETIDNNIVDLKHLRFYYFCTFYSRQGCIVSAF
jgi:hypothetical protein